MAGRSVQRIIVSRTDAIVATYSIIALVQFQLPFPSNNSSKFCYLELEKAALAYIRGLGRG